MQHTNGGIALRLLIWVRTLVHEAWGFHALGQIQEYLFSLTCCFQLFVLI